MESTRIKIRSGYHTPAVLGAEKWAITHGYPKCPWGLHTSPPLVGMVVVGLFLLSFFFLEGKNVRGLHRKKKYFSPSPLLFSICGLQQNKITQVALFSICGLHFQHSDGGAFPIQQLGSEGRRSDIATMRELVNTAGPDTRNTVAPSATAVGSGPVQRKGGHQGNAWYASDIVGETRTSGMAMRCTCAGDVPTVTAATHAVAHAAMPSLTAETENRASRVHGPPDGATRGLGLRVSLPHRVGGLARRLVVLLSAAGGAYLSLATDPCPLGWGGGLVGLRPPKSFCAQNRPQILSHLW